MNGLFRELSEDASYLGNTLSGTAPIPLLSSTQTVQLLTGNILCPTLLGTSPA